MAKSKPLIQKGLKKRSPIDQFLSYRYSRLKLKKSYMKKSTIIEVKTIFHININLVFGLYIQLTFVFLIFMTKTRIWQWHLYWRDTWPAKNVLMSSMIKYFLIINSAQVVFWCQWTSVSNQTLLTERLLEILKFHIPVHPMFWAQLKHDNVVFYHMARSFNFSNLCQWYGDIGS